MSNPHGPVRRRRIAGEPAPSVEPEAAKPKKKAAAKKPAATKPATKPAPTKPAPKKIVPERTKAKVAAVDPSATVAAAIPAPTGIATPAPEPKPDRDDGWRAPTGWFAGLVGALIASVVFAAFFGVRGVQDVRDHNEAKAVAASNVKASAAAGRAAQEIFSYAYNKLDQHVTESKKLMTPAFRKQFDKIAPALTELAPQNKIVVKALAQESAAVPCGDECDAGKVSVLVFLDQARLVGASTTPTVFGNRILVDMVKRDGAWLVNDIQAL